MAPVEPGFLAVGHLSKAHGIKGQIFVSLLTDHPEGAFAPGVVLRLADGAGRVPDPDAPPLRVVASQPHRNGVLVAFAGITTRSGAEQLRGRYVLRELAELEPLGEGEIFYHQLVGSSVATVDGVELGTVVEVFELAPADLLEVRGPERSFMIPFRREIVVDVDVDARRLVIDPPEGLLDL